jgi:hypothetical protein
MEAHLKSSSMMKTCSKFQRLNFFLNFVCDGPIKVTHSHIKTKPRELWDAPHKGTHNQYDNGSLLAFFMSLELNHFRVYCHALGVVFNVNKTNLILNRTELQIVFRNL